jgi:hypothetical protein
LSAGNAWQEAAIIWVKANLAPYVIATNQSQYSLIFTACLGATPLSNEQECWG